MARWVSWCANGCSHAPQDCEKRVGLRRDATRSNITILLDVQVYATWFQRYHPHLSEHDSTPRKGQWGSTWRLWSGSCWRQADADDGATRARTDMCNGVCTQSVQGDKEMRTIDWTRVNRGLILFWYIVSWEKAYFRCVKFGNARWKLAITMIIMNEWWPSEDYGKSKRWMLAAYWLISFIFVSRDRASL